MYVAGLNLTLTPTVTSPGLAEPLVYTTVLASVGSFLLRANQRMKLANEKGGEIKRWPTSIIGKLVTPVHGIATIAAPAIYLVTMPFTGFKQPEFFENTALPDFAELGEVGKVVVRFAAGVAMACLFRIGTKAIDHLDKQFHYIGVSTCYYHFVLGDCLSINGFCRFVKSQRLLTPVHTALFAIRFTRKYI